MGPEGVVSVAVAICITSVGCGGVFALACLAKRQFAYPLFLEHLSAKTCAQAIVDTENRDQIGLGLFVTAMALWYAMYNRKFGVDKYPLTAGVSSGFFLGSAMVLWAICLQHICLTLFPTRNPYGIVALPEEVDDDTDGLLWCNAQVVPAKFQRIPNGIC